MECELPDKLAGLDLVEGVGAETAGATPAPARVLRKRKSLLPEEGKPSNRRVQVKPRKRLASEMSSPKEIEALYLNKKVKPRSQSLETISEEPTETVTLVGGRKVKRQLSFQLGAHYTKEKIKKRRSKIKKFLGNKSFLNRKKIPMHVFLKAIKCLELDKDLIEDKEENAQT